MQAIKPSCYLSRNNDWYRNGFLASNKKHIKFCKVTTNDDFPIIYAIPDAIFMLKAMKVPVKVKIVNLKHSKEKDQRILNSCYHELQSLMFASSVNLLFLHIYYRKSHFYTNLVVYQSSGYEKNFPLIEKSFFQFHYWKRFKDQMTPDQYQRMIAKNHLAKYFCKDIFSEDHVYVKNKKADFKRIKSVKHFHKELFRKYAKGKITEGSSFRIVPFALTGVKHTGRFLLDVKRFRKTPKIFSAVGIMERTKSQRKEAT